MAPPAEARFVATALSLQRSAGNRATAAWAAQRLQRIRNSTTTVQSAADAFLEKFEKRADPEASRGARRNAAQRAARLYHDAHPAPASGP